MYNNKNNNKNNLLFVNIQINFLFFIYKIKK